MSRRRVEDAADADMSVAPTTRNERRALVAILAIALAVRLVAVLQAQAWNPDFHAPQMDALFHVEWARAIAKGVEYLDGPFFRAPLYPLFLAGVFKLAGDGLLAPRIVQALLGVGTCGLAFLAARHLASTRTALGAALLCALCPMLAFFETELLLPVLECFLGSLGLWTVLRARAEPSAGRLVLAGLALGLACIVRPNFLVVAALLAGWLFATAPAARLRVAALYLLGVALPIAPVALVNAREGDFALVATQGGVNLWIGNNPASDGSTAIVPGTRPDWWGGYHDAIAQAESAEGRALSATEVSDHYTSATLAWWSAEPLAALRLFAWKLHLLALDHELGNNQDDAYYLATYTPLLSWLPARFGVLLPLAVLGLWALRRTPGSGALALMLCGYAATIVLFFVCARFRAPLLPWMAIAAAAGSAQLVAALRQRRGAALAAQSLVLACVAVLCFSTPDAIDTSGAQGPWQAGVAAVRRGDDVAALRSFDGSIRLKSDLWMVHKDRALCLQRLGRLAEARDAARRAAELAPGAIDAQRARVSIELQAGDLAAAWLAANAAVAAAPLSSDAAYDVGRVAVALSTTGRFAEGDRALANSALLAGARHARDPQSAFNCHYARAELGRLAGDQQARFEAATAATELYAAPDAAGWYWRAQEQRLEALVASGRRARATEEAQELLRRHPEVGWLKRY
jgi:4-amino-4-deoxy-L-arabinose transferase-like glycosyltransferase